MLVSPVLWVKFLGLFKSRWKLFRNCFIASPQINGANLLDSRKLNFVKGKFYQKETFELYKKSRKVHLFADKFSRIGSYVCKKSFLVNDLLNVFNNPRPLAARPLKF